jgi:hypothetical protein
MGDAGADMTKGRNGGVVSNGSLPSTEEAKAQLKVDELEIA